MTKQWMLVLLLITGCLAPTWALDQLLQLQDPKENLQTREAEAGPGVLVKFRPGLTRTSIQRMAAARQLTVAHEFKIFSLLSGRTYALMISNNRSNRALVQELSTFPEVEWVGLDDRLFCQTIPDDSLFGQQWALNNTGQSGGTADADIDAPEAWEMTTGSEAVILAGIDGGVDYRHPDLQPNMWRNPNEIAGNGLDDDGNGYIDDIHGINSAVNTGDPLDDNGHGSHTAGIMAAVGNNGQGISGVCPKARIMALKFLVNGSGYTSNAIKCIDYILDQKINHQQNIVAVNASWGGGSYNQILFDAIRCLGEQNIIFVAVAGNSSNNIDVTPYYPACYGLANIVAVTATDHNDAQKYNYGPKSVDLGAPGYNILSTVVGRYVPQSGDIFFDDLESGSAKWESGGIPNNWAISENQEVYVNPLFPVPSPTHFLSDSPGVNYLSNSDTWLAVKDPIDLTAFVNQPLYLGFGSAWGFRANDHGFVEISNDGGITWKVIADFTNASYYWLNKYNYLIPEEYKVPNFKFRFHITSDSSSERAGFLIDNVGIGQKISYIYESMSGTSMAAPGVTGALALLSSQFPGEPFTDRVLRLLLGGDAVASLAGKCLSGRRLNLTGSLQFRDFPPYLASVSVDEYVTPGKEFSITGSHFGAGTGSVIWINASGQEFPCAVLAWSDSQVKAVAPDVPAGVYSLFLKNAAGVISFNFFTQDSWPQGTPVFAEDFENEFPAQEWQVIDSAGTGLVWTRNDRIGADNHSSGDGLCATANSDKLDEAGLGMDTALITPRVFLNPGYSRMVLSLRHYFYFGYGSSAQLDVSIDDGQSWANLATWNASSRGPGKEKFDLQAYLGKTVQFRFGYNDGKYWSFFWDLDDVEILAWGSPIDLRKDIAGSWPGLGVWFYNGVSGLWSRMLDQEARQLVLADLDNDGLQDLLGWWPGDPGGIWLHHASGAWEFILSDADLLAIAAGDLNGDGWADLVGSWTHGVWWRDSQAGNWSQLNPLAASIITCGDYDADGRDDLCGSWPGIGVWTYSSGPGSWQLLTADDSQALTDGDLNGDKRDDILGSWNSGTWVFESAGSHWSFVLDSAQCLAAADLDGDARDDLIGSWSNAPGVWWRSSATGGWSRLIKLSPQCLSASILK